jgi:hypothetical protein
VESILCSKLYGYKRYNGAWAPLLAVFGEGDLELLFEEGDEPPFIEEILEEEEDRLIIGGASVVPDEEQDPVVVEVFDEVNLHTSFS